MKKIIIPFFMALISTMAYAGPDPRGILELEGFANSDSVGITSKRGKGDFYIPEALASNSAFFFIKGYGWNGSAFATNSAASIEFLANQAWTTTNNGSKIVFKTTPDGTSTPVTGMTLDDDGNLSITGNLSVSGTGATTGATTFSSMTVTNQQVWGATTAKSTFTPTALTLDDGLTLTVNGKILGPVPTAQTIGAGGTITADACGGIKKISSAGSVTTDTTNTFTAPAAANTGCVMHLVNSGSNNIVLDNNALFVSAGGADVTVTANDTLLVGSDGSKWYQLSALLAN